jgi:hypothetical protein
MGNRSQRDLWRRPELLRALDRGRVDRMFGIETVAGVVAHRGRLPLGGL